jgi:sulfur-carrier protein adenylyltransferase/sulfurtransferase
MKEITVQELKQKLDKAENIQLIDVREEYEFDIANLKGELIPLASVLDNVDRISKDKPVIVYCKTGRRSASIINILESRLGFTNLYNLKGGILEYAREVDPSLPTY